MPQVLSHLTPATFRILSFFLENPRAEFHEREVLRKAATSKGSANRILRRLSELRLLERSARGRMVFYRLNADDPFVKHMKVLLNVGSLQPFVYGLEPSARKIVLFGSCAEGTDSADSDIDLFILTQEKTRAKNRVTEFNRKHRRQIAPIIVDVEELTSLKREDRPLFERIDRGIVLWGTA